MMDCYFMTPNSTVNEQTIISVKDCRHENITNHDVLKKGVEGVLARESGARVQRDHSENRFSANLLVFRNRKFEICLAQIWTEEEAKVDARSKGVVENTVMLLRGVIRTSEKQPC